MSGAAPLWIDESTASPASLTYLDPVMKRSSVAGVVFVALLSAMVVVGSTPVLAPSGSAAVASASSGATYRCVMDAFGQAAGKKVVFRRVVNTRVEVARATREPVNWRPISWGLVSAYGGRDFETTRQLVASTDGKVRLVETAWDSKDANLDLRVVKVVGRGYPHRLVTVDAHFIHWVAEDGVLHRARWTGKRFARPTRVPVSLGGATAIASYMTDYGMRIYYTDRHGALHVVAVNGRNSTDTVLRPSGYRGTTGLKAGNCMSPNYANVRPFHGLLTVNRGTGLVRFQRALRSEGADGGQLTKSSRVRPSGWTWPRLG